jgi:hypothetical protein
MSSTRPRAFEYRSFKIAFLFDPWGTYIELTEGLAPKKSATVSEARKQ